MSLKNVPWFLIAFICLSGKSLYSSINLAESFFLLGLIAFHAYQAHVSQKNQLVNEKQLQINTELHNRIVSLENKNSLRDSKLRG